jgi:hypothetical protein
MDETPIFASVEHDLALRYDELRDGAATAASAANGAAASPGLG